MHFGLVWCSLPIERKDACTSVLSGVAQAGSVPCRPADSFAFNDDSKTSLGFPMTFHGASIILLLIHEPKLFQGASCCLDLWKVATYANLVDTLRRVSGT